MLGTDVITEDKEPAEYNDDFFDLTGFADYDVFGVDLSDPTCSPKNAENRRISEGGDQNADSDLFMDVDESQEEEMPGMKMRTRSQTKLSSVAGKGLQPQANKTEKAESSGKSKSFKKSRKVVTDESDTPLNSKNKSNPQQPGTQRSTVKPHGTEASAAEDGGSVLENLLDMQDTLHKPSQIGEPSIGSTVKEATAKHVTRKPWSNSLKTNWRDHIKVRTNDLCYGMSYF